MIQPTFKTFSNIKDNAVLDSIKALLQRVDLNLDPHIDDFIVAIWDQQIIACAGLDSNVIKCVAVHPDYQGANITLGLVQKTIEHAHDKGHHHLFLYTKPQNVHFFKTCGFYPIVELDDTITLMENTPVGISNYCQSLAKVKKAGTCGAIVMNANPFTCGHLYLAQQAAKEVDWLYIFVVSEDKSLFPADIRYKLVKEGVSHMSNVTVLPGSAYIISKATFPSYFLKQQVLIEQSYMAIDLLIFRQYIAPALSISYRFVGTEPHSEVTNAYNQAMKDWLQRDIRSNAPAIKVVEIARATYTDDVISASRVRSLLMQQKYQQVQALVPPTTWAYIEQNYVIKKSIGKSMKITHTALAGTLESSDLLVKIEPNEKLEIVINSDVNKQFGQQIRHVVQETLAQLNVGNGLIIIDDKGALDCVIKARVQSAVLRACDEKAQWSQLL